MKACLAGAAPANHKYILVDIVLWDAVSSHHDPLRLREQDIVLKLRINKRPDVLFRPPPCAAVFPAVTVFLCVFPSDIHDKADKNQTGCTPQDICQVQPAQGIF